MAIVGLVAFLLTVGRSRPEHDNEQATSQVESAEPEPAEVDAEPPRELIVEDDGNLLWASPTAGPPVSLAYLPDGAQVILHLRPAWLASHPEGEKVAASLGPWGEAAIEAVEEVLGTDFAELEALTLAVIIDPSGQLAPIYRAELRQAMTDETLIGRFPRGVSERNGSQQFLRTGSRSYFLPTQFDGRVLIACPNELIDSLISAGGAEAVVVRDLQRLITRTDADRAATLVISPKFLEAGGGDLLGGAAVRLRDALDWLTGREATAFLLSAHWGDDFFLELLATPELQIPPRRFALRVREQIEQSSDLLEDVILSAAWDPYGRKVLARFPSMLRKLAGYTRAAEENKMAVLRTYLPTVAGHNLLMAGELLMTQNAHPTVSAPPVTAAPTETLDDRLAATTSLVFTKDTLERAVELLADDMGVPIEIRGQDLQLEGITKNQSFGIELRQRSAAEILLEILQQANPDRTSEGPTDPRQKLVYVIQRDSAGGGRIIVTTRSAAASRGDQLPPVFRQSAP